MIHEAYMPVYRCPDFHCGRVRGCAGPPEVVQEALADLKNSKQIKKEERYFPQGIF